MQRHETRTPESMARPLGKGLAAVVAVSLLAGCAKTHSADYRPRLPGGLAGYSDLQLSANRQLVSFSGSPANTKDDVQSHLLHRAAELTLQTGHMYFELANRRTEWKTYYARVPANDRIGDSYYYAYPYGYGPAWGNGWSPGRYSAHADVAMLDAAEAARNPQAISALEVLQRLPPPFAVASDANVR